MASDLTTKILIEIRDAMRAGFAGLGERIDETNVRIDDANRRLSILARLTRSIDGRLQKIEDREPDRVFVPQRVESLEETSRDHEARIARLESED